VLKEDDSYRRLLSRRVSRNSIVLGRAYVIFARNGGVGVAVEEDGLVGYQLHRVKFGSHYLFVEYDWADDKTFGTVIPLAVIDETPPCDDIALLAWLRQQELAHQAMIADAWCVILGPHVRWAPES
jgi:hypothetical protein